MAREKILIVEDEAIVAMDIRVSLRNLGYVPSVVSSGEEAIQKTEKSHPDLVLMDIMLKGEMDGVEAAGEIRSRFNIPVVYLTAYSDQDTLKRAKITEPFGYLLKPFQERDLLVTIEMVLHKHKLEGELRLSKESFNNIVNKSVDGIIIVDQQGIVRFINPALESLLNRKVDELLGEIFDFPVVPGDVSEVDIIRPGLP